MIRYGEPEPEPKGVKMIDAASGKPVIVQEFQLDQHLRMLLIPLLTEAGLYPDTLTKYDHAASQLVGLAIAQVRDLRSRLEQARKEFAKLKAKQDADHATMLKFMGMFVNQHQQHAQPAESDNVIPLRKAA
jgi:hypothetical protein